MNKARNFIVWVNEEDHIRIISMQKGASLKQVWTRLARAIRAIESTRLEFVCHEKFGYLTFCPTNIGTTLRASVHVKLPRIGADKNKLKDLCDQLDLQPRGLFQITYINLYREHRPKNQNHKILYIKHKIIILASILNLRKAEID
jgi:protein-arginine kinase